MGRHARSESAITNPRREQGTRSPHDKRLRKVRSRTILCESRKRGHSPSSSRAQTPQHEFYDDDLSWTACKNYIRASTTPRHTHSLLTVRSRWSRGRRVSRARAPTPDRHGDRGDRSIIASADRASRVHASRSRPAACMQEPRGVSRIFCGMRRQKCKRLHPRWAPACTCRRTGTLP